MDADNSAPNALFRGASLVLTRVASQEQRQEAAPEGERPFPMTGGSADGGAHDPPLREDWSFNDELRWFLTPGRWG